MARYDLGELIWKITGDSKPLETATNNVDKAINNTAKNTVVATNTMKAAFASLAAVAAPYLVIAKMVEVGKASLGAASDFEEASNKFNVTFAANAVQANKWADEFAQAYVTSRKESRSLLAATGDLLAGFGFASGEALNLSLQVNKLAADLVSFQNYEGGVEGASQSLTSALLGEREAVKSLGIVILDADVKAKVLQLRQEGLTFATQRQAEAYATLQLAIEQSQNAIGDVQRSIGTYAQETRDLATQWSDLLANLGDTGGKAATAIHWLSTEMGDFNKWLESADDRKLKALTNQINELSKARAMYVALQTSWGVQNTVLLKAALGGLIDQVDKGISKVKQQRDIMTMADPEIEKYAHLKALRDEDLKQSKFAANQKAQADAEAAEKAGKEAERKAKQEEAGRKAKIKSDKEAADKSAQVTKQSAEDALKIASDLAHDYGTSQSELTQIQIRDAYQLVKGIQSSQQDAINAAKAGNKEAAQAAEESAKRQIEALNDVAAAAKTSAQNRLDYDKEVVEKQKEAQAALDSLTPEGLVYYSLYGSEPPDQLTKDAADAYNEAARQEQAAKEALDKLTPGGLIAYSLMGEAGYEGTVEQLADQASEIASMLGDMYDRMGDIVNQYYQNQIDSINADRDARKDAIDAETEAKINSLDKSAMSEEDYNNTVDAINNEADAKKAAIERDAAQRTYQIQLAQFKAKQQFDIGETISNTAVAVMKAYSQLGIFGKVMAVVIAGMGAMQVANIKSQQPPEPPAFANGGIVPAVAGAPSSGDKVIARVNPGELILNEAQQDTISGKLSNNSPINITIITPDKRTLYKGIYDASKRGEVLIDTRAVVK